MQEYGSGARIRQHRSAKVAQKCMTVLPAIIDTTYNTICYMSMSMHAISYITKTSYLKFQQHLQTQIYKLEVCGATYWAWCSFASCAVT